MVWSEDLPEHAVIAKDAVISVSKDLPIKMKVNGEWVEIGTAHSQQRDDGMYILIDDPVVIAAMGLHVTRGLSVSGRLENEGEKTDGK